MPKVVFTELMVGGIFAGQRAFVQGDADNHSRPGFGRHGQDLGNRFLLKQIEDDLHHVDQSVAHQLDYARLILLGRADTDQVDLPLVTKLPQHQQRLRIVVPGSRPGMQLQQVDPFGIQVPQPIMDV